MRSRWKDVDGKVVTKAESGSCFGELSLIYGTSRPSAARAASPTVRLWALARTVFRKLQIAMCMDSLEKSFRTAQSGCTMSQITTRAQESATLIQDGLRLKPHTVIGSGTAGVVAIVEAIEGSAPGGAADYPGPTASGGGGGGFPGNQIFALKQMSKRRLLENQMLKQALFEKESLLQCRDSPFVVKLVHTFQDESHVYFLSEFAQGGDLMESILDCKDNGEEDADEFQEADILDLEGNCGGFDTPTTPKEEIEVSEFVLRFEEHNRQASVIQADLEKKIAALLENDHEATLLRIEQDIGALKAEMKRLRRLFAFRASHGIDGIKS